MSTVIVTQDNISSEVFDSSMPVLMDFWSVHSGQMGIKSTSTVEKIGEELQDVAKIVHINVNDEPDIAYKFKVDRVPTMLVWRGGTVTDTIVGSADTNMLKWLLSQNCAEQ